MTAEAVRERMRCAAVDRGATEAEVEDLSARWVVAGEKTAQLARLDDVVSGSPGLARNGGGVPAQIAPTVEPMGGYHWYGSENRQRACEHFEAPLHACSNGLEDQARMHAELVRDAWHRDTADSAVAGMGCAGLEAKPFAVHDWREQAPFTVAGPDWTWLVARAEDSDRLVPLEALRALTLAKQSGMVWV